MLSFRIPAVLLLQNIVKREKALVARRRDPSLSQLFENGTALLLGMRTFSITAITYTVVKLPEGFGQVLLREKVEPFEIEH